jgi:glycosyltransferase involved in cell wall biosynthesis
MPTLQPRRILLLITDLEIGGTPTVVREIALRLRDEAHLEVACLSKWGPVADQIRDGGVEVTALGARGPSDFHVVRDLVQFIRDRQFDTVFSFLIHANTAAAIASRFCCELRFIQSIQTTQPYPKWHWILQRVVHHAADTVVVPSSSAARAAREWADIREEKVVVVPNAICAPDERGFTLALSRSTGRGESRVGFLGRLDPIKRVPDLLRAMTFLDERFTLHIYGDGEDRARIDEHIDALGLRSRVVLHGAIAKPQAALETFDVLVLPSQAEGFGLVLIEAMSMGIPVVATDVPGIRDVVCDNVNGLLVPIGNPERIAAAVRRLSEDDALRKRLIEAGLDDVRHKYDWSVVLPQYRRLLKLNDHV